MLHQTGSFHGHPIGGRTRHNSSLAGASRSSRIRLIFVAFWSPAFAFMQKRCLPTALLPLFLSAGLLLLLPPSYGQTASQGTAAQGTKLEFEVVSIKANRSGSPGSIFGPPRGDRVSYTNVTFENAYSHRLPGSGLSDLRWSGLARLRAIRCEREV
jgi:hypothetical protein